MSFFGSAATDRPEMTEDQAEDITVAAEKQIIAKRDDALTFEPGSSEALAIVLRQLLDSDTVLCGSTEKKVTGLPPVSFAYKFPSTFDQPLQQITNARNTIDSGAAFISLLQMYDLPQAKLRKNIRKRHAICSIVLTDTPQKILREFHDEKKQIKKTKALQITPKTKDMKRKRKKSICEQ